MATTEDDVVVRLRLKDVARFIAEVRAGTLSIDELEKKISRAGRTAAKESSPSGGGFGMFASLMKHMAFAVPLALGGMGVAAGGFAIKTAADLEQVHVSFETMLGSASAADDMIKNLQTMAKNTPFRLSGIEDATQQLLGMDFQAKNIIPTLQSVADAAAGLKMGDGDISGLILTLGQIQSKGVLRGDEIEQLNERKINAKKYLREALGLNPVELQKQLDAGKISSDKALPIIISGMEKRFAGLAAKQSKTLGGVWSNLLDGVQQGLGEIVKPYVPALTQWIQQLIDNIPQYQAILTRVVSNIVGYARTAVDLGKILFTKISDFTGEAKAWAQGLIDQIGSALGDGNWSGVGQMIGKSLANAMKGSGSTGSVDWFDVGKSATKGVITFAIGFVSELLDPGMWFGIIKDHWFDILMILVVVLTDGLGGLLGKIATVLKRIPGLKWAGHILGWIQDGASWLRPKLLKPISAIARAFGDAFVRVFPEAGVRIWYWFTKLQEFFTGGGLKNLALRAARWAGGIATRALEAIFEAILRFGKWLVEKVVDIAVGLGGRVGAAILGALVPVIQWLHDQWVKVKGWFSDDSIMPGAPGGPPPVNGGSATQPGPMIMPGMAATGGTVDRPGLTWVGERGPELLNLPRGSKVIPLPRSGDFSGVGGAREIHTHVSVDGKEILHAVHRAQDDKMARR